jgi:hypothetical protein
MIPAIARIINGNCKVRCQLKRTFTTVNYDRETFILQATGYFLKKSIVFQKRASLLQTWPLLRLKGAQLN